MVTIASDPKTYPVVPIGKRVAIYVRVSNETQADNYSLDTQLDGCLAYASERGYTVDEAHIYREVFSGMELDERPELTRLREAMARGEFDVILCYDPDRFSRNQIHAAMLQYFCDKAGVALEFAQFRFEDSATGRFLLSARTFAAELEFEQRKERTRRGQQARTESGKLLGRCAANFGYRYTDKRREQQELDPVTAPIARDIFRWYLEGLATRVIASRLDALGVPPPQGDAWHHSSVAKMLQNEAYIGIAYTGKTSRRREKGRTVRVKHDKSAWVRLPDGTIPPLVDSATWEAVQARFARNKRESHRHNSQPERFLLRAGYVVCAHCGRTLLGTYINTRGQRRSILVYKAEPERHRACAAPRPDGTPGASFTVHAEKVDADAWAKVERYLDDPAQFEALQASQDAPDPSIERLAALAALDEQARKEGARLAKAVATLGDDAASAPLLAELEAVAARRKEIARQREEAEASQRDWAAGKARTQELIDRWLAAGKKRGLGQLSYQERRDTIASLGVFAVVKNDGTWWIDVAQGAIVSNPCRWRRRPARRASPAARGR